MTRPSPLVLIALLLSALAAPVHSAVPTGHADAPFSNVAGPEAAPLLRESETFTAAIEIRNPYDRAVRVRRPLDATCSCATLEIRDVFLLPGESTVIDISVVNANKSGPQDVRIYAYVTDPEFEPIEALALWSVRPTVAVDALPPGADPLARPADSAWRDIYRLFAEERPDEPQRLKRRLRLSCPPEEAPKEGLQVLGIDYAGKLWSLTPRRQDDGSWLVAVGPKEGLDMLPEGDHLEQAVIRTNHPGKPAITIRLDASITKDAGRRAVDPFGAGGFPPPPMPGP